jgi:hypothetical protein
LKTDIPIHDRSASYCFPILYLIAVLIIILSRWYYVESFAVALPFWDQWDAEGDCLLRPWIEGTFRLSDLWRPQNEHRLIPSHLVTLISYELTGSWSNLSESRFNIVLGAIMPLILIWHLHKRNALYGWRYLLVPVLVAGASLPFAWENILFGFQSQFYFLCIFTLIVLILASRYPFIPAAVIGMFVLCVLSALTMASGLLTPIAAASIYLLHLRMLPVRKKQAWLIIVALIMIAVLAYVTMPYNPDHDVLHARNVTEFVMSFIRYMGWPLTARKIITVVMWLPAAAIMFVMIKSRRMSKIDILMAGCFIWSTLQVAAMAYGRGHELGEIISRYTDLLTLGLAGNAWFILRSGEVFRPSVIVRYGFHLLAIVFFVGVFVSYNQRYRSGIKSMRHSYHLRSIQEENVLRYLNTGDSKYLVPKSIPYPDPVRLKKLLDNPALRGALPFAKSHNGYIK